MHFKSEHQKNIFLTWLVIGVVFLVAIFGFAFRSGEFFSQSYGSPEEVIQHYTSNDQSNETLMDLTDYEENDNYDLYQDDKKVIYVMRNRLTNRFLFRYHGKKVYILRIISKDDTKSYKYLLLEDQDGVNQPQQTLLNEKQFHFWTAKPSLGYSMQEINDLGGNLDVW